MKRLDLLIVKPGAQKALYQELGESLSGREPPLWAALLAAFIREKGFKVQIIDAEVEFDRLVPTVRIYQPRIIAIVVSGTNPSASTMNMIGARAILEKIAGFDFRFLTILIGLHPSALPERTLKEEPVDLVCQGEGFCTLLDLLCGVDYKNIRGLCYKEKKDPVCNPRSELVNPDQLPMPAWDLLPMEKYKAHNWHCFGRLQERAPYGVIYTSLGCPFNCSFCCINAIFGEHKIRYRNIYEVIKEIDFLVRNYSIKNFKIIDEMFALNESRVIELCDLIIERRYNLNIWAYARVDTVSRKMLGKMKQAGINWLGIGFESGNKRIRDRVTKGSFNNQKLREAVELIRANGIYIGANFIFGLPGDSLETMQETVRLAEELNCEYTNFYVAMAYPGSQLYRELSVDNGSLLPDSWSGYSQFSYETQPLPTEFLSPAEILRFRDSAFNGFYNSEDYQDMILAKFGRETLRHIKDMLRHNLKRRLLGD